MTLKSEVHTLETTINENLTPFLFYFSTKLKDEILPSCW